MRRLRGDATALGRVVHNLLDNALRHQPGRVSVRAEGARAVLVVADDGPGIPAADRERVLERFTRLDDARSQDAGRTGLGLAIAHEIVRAHRGEVTIQDTGPTDGDRWHGSGARFVVGLPAEQAAREVQRQPPMLVAPRARDR